MRDTGARVEVNGPIIDKLSMVLNCESSECQGQAVYIDSLVDRHYWLKQLPKNFQGARYYFNWSIMLNEDTGARCLLQASPAMGQIRIEFNPEKSGEAGLVALSRRLELLLMNYSAALFVSGAVTRVDIAVDARPVCLDYLKLTALGMSVSENKYGAGGASKETAYLGSTRSKLRFAVYDKYQESGRPVYSDTVRFEARIRRSMSLRDLSLVANPFERLLVSDFFETPEATRQSHRYLHFFDSVRQRGLNPALALISDSRTRKRYRDLFGELYDCEWWNPEAFWSGYAGCVSSIHSCLLKCRPDQCE